MIAKHIRLVLISTLIALNPISTLGQCSSANNCADCMAATPQTANFCTWFEDMQYCAEGCDMNGCGASACASDINTCKECLGLIQHKQYAWSPNTKECVTSCSNAPADAPCFPGKTYGPEVCDCSEFTSCAECLKMDKCAWSVGSCLDSCADAPADAACFPGADYEPDVCPQGMSVASADPRSNSGGKVSVSFAFFALLIGHAFIMGWK